MKKVLLLLVAMVASLSAWADVTINETNFPDANFRNWLLSEPYGSDGVLTDGEIAAIITIDVSSNSIADLTGIEHLTALKNLYCIGNQLTALDVSHNTALIFLACNNNQLTALDVSQNTALNKLYCYNNQLTALDVCQNTALKNLNCSDNQLTELYVSQNTALETLDCSNNSLTELEVSQNTALEALYCSNNQLAQLDVTQNTALKRLRCSNIQLTQLDVSQNTALAYLCCSNNQLTALDVCQNTALETLDCSNIQLTELDVSQNTALEVLYCSNNQLSQLDVTQNTALGALDCSGNQINGGNMEALVASLPTVDVDYWGENGWFIVIDLDSETEQNVITTTQVGTARGKNWTVYGLTGDDWQEYDGIELTYAISLPESFEHGTVECDKTTAAEGETVTLTVTADEGYELETLIVTFTNEDEPSGAPLRLRGGSLELTPGENGTYTFQMPAAPVTVNATFKESFVTGVEDINVVTAKRGQRYNLLGQPVAGDYKGIVIENGKKIIVR